MARDTRRRALLLAASMLGTFVILRASLAIRPNADFNVGAYNIHHLFTGLLVVTASAIPLAIRGPSGRLGDVLVAGLGIGLSMALDEWVYLIATDGTNASYGLPVSLWGAVIVIGAALVYTLLVTTLSGSRPEGEY